MGDNDRRRERGLVLAPNEFASVSDETKGNVNVCVGPHKTSLAVSPQGAEGRRPVRVFGERVAAVLARLLEGTALASSLPGAAPPAT